MFGFTISSIIRRQVFFLGPTDLEIKFSSSVKMTDSFLVSLTVKEVANTSFLKTVAYVGAIVLEIASQEFESAQTFVQANCGLLDIYCDCTAISDIEKIILLLNSGCTNVIVNESSLSALAAEGFTQEHLARLTLSLEHILLSSEKDAEDELDKIVVKYGHRVHGGLNVLFNASSLSAILERIRVLGVQNKCFLKWTRNPGDEVFSVIRKGYRVILPSAHVSLQKQDAVTKTFIPNLITKSLRSDRADGLFPTIVTDESGLSLGLVYSNIESIEKAVLLGRGVYYSRSRGGLWIKGEESGNVQELRKISLDCDADALQFTVRQTGDGEQFSYSPRPIFK